MLGTPTRPSVIGDLVQDTSTGADAELLRGGDVIGKMALIPGGRGALSLGGSEVAARAVEHRGVRPTPDDRLGGRMARR